MPIFHAIAAMSENRVIGHHGKIPWHLPEDFRWFKHKTMGGTLIMGRKTFQSIGKPLPGRDTVVLTRHGSAKGATTCRDVSHLDQTLSSLADPYWICGGAEIYRQLLPACAALYLTRVKRTVEGDTFFPNFEDTFQLHGIVHETPEFRVECWLHPSAMIDNPLDPAPFA